MSGEFVKYKAGGHPSAMGASHHGHHHVPASSIRIHKTLTSAGTTLGGSPGFSLMPQLFSTRGMKWRSALNAAIALVTLLIFCNWWSEGLRPAVDSVCVFVCELCSVNGAR